MKLKVNKTISLSKINNDETLVYQDNSFKSIECDFDILTNVLKIIDKSGDEEDIYSYYEKEFSKEEIDQFLDVLASEKIIYIRQDIPLVDKASILLVSDHDISDTIISGLKDVINVVKVIENVNEVEEEIKLFEYDCVFIAKSEMKYKEGIWLNDILVKNNIPFIIMRYDGKSLISGPFVFPMKGSCFECSLEHHIDKLNENNGVHIKLKNMFDLSMAKPLNIDVYGKVFDFCLEKIKKDITKLKLNRTNFHFFQKEDILDVETNELKVCEYYPITSCSCCNGMTQKLFLINKKEDLVVPENKPLFREYDKKIAYMKGGLRSISAEDTKKIIDKALGKMKIDINLRRVENKFKNILPVYKIGRAHV